MDSNITTWVILLNSNACRIFSYNKKNLQLDLLKEINHPENKLHDIDLVSDKPGRYKSGNAAHGAYSPRTDPKEVLIDKFIHEVANALEHNRAINAYDKLIIIAAAHVYGLLLGHMNKNVKSLIIKNLEKDLIHASNPELLQCLAKA